jgi:uncharacterized repeat protein (TIGR01451 family)
MLAVAASAMFAQSAAAQLDSPRLGSDISLYVNGGAETAVLPVIAETASSDLLTYEFATSEIRFSAGVLAPSYDDPLFCFDMGTPSSPISIQMKDPNGHIVIDDFELGASLQYVLAAPSSLVVEPTVNQQCFYRSSQGVFGLFGQEFSGQPEPEGLISRDRFEPDLSMSLAFQDVPQFATPGQSIAYDLVLSNTGSGDFNDVALQELFPENLGVYAAALTGTQITCTASGGAVCPTIGTESFLRFKNPAPGVDIPAGGSLTFNIERTVDANSTTGEVIRLHAGALADPVATGVPFAVDEAVITVIGQSAGLNVAAEPTAAGDEATIVVTVLDSSQNPVPNEPVTLDDPDGLTITSPTSGTSDALGEVVFTGTATVAQTYSPSFSSGGLTGSGDVTYTAAAPDSYFLAATDSEAVADDSDTVTIQMEVVDFYGNPVDSAMVETVNKDGLSSLPNEVFTDVSGQAVITATTTVAGTYDPSFTVAGLATNSVTVDFIAGDVADLAYVENASSVAVNATMTPAVRLRLVDQFGNWKDTDNSTFVQLNLIQGSTIIQNNIASATASNGEVEFANLSFGPSLEGTGYRLQAVVTFPAFFGENSALFDITAPQ